MRVGGVFAACASATAVLRRIQILQLMTNGLKLAAIQGLRSFQVDCYVALDNDPLPLPVLRFASYAPTEAVQPTSQRPNIQRWKNQQPNHANRQDYCKVTDATFLVKNTAA